MSDIPSPMLSTAFNDLETASPIVRQLQFSPLRKLKPLNPVGPPMKVELELAGRKSPLYDKETQGGITINPQKMLERRSLGKDAFGTILQLNSV